MFARKVYMHLKPNSVGKFTRTQAEPQKEACFFRNRGHGDLRLTRDSGGRMVLRRNGIEIRNPIQLGFACNERWRKHYPDQAILKFSARGVGRGRAGFARKRLSSMEPRSGFVAAVESPGVYCQITRVRRRQDAIRKISWMGIYRAGRLVNVRSGGNLVSGSVICAGSK